MATQGKRFLCKQQDWRQLMKRRIITTVTVCVFLALVLAVRLSDREKNDNSIPSKETVPRIFWKRVSNMRQSSCGHRTETVSAAAGESRMSCRPGSGRMCGTLMRTQRFLYSMIQKITTRQSVLHLGKKEDREEKRCFWRIP